MPLNKPPEMKSAKSNTCTRRFERIQRWRQWIPEVAAYEDEDACLRDWRAAMSQRVFLYSQIVGATIAAMTAMFGLFYLPAPLRLIPLDNIIWKMLIISVAAASCSFGSLWLWRTRMRRFLQQRLRERGVLVCTHCGYNLAGNETGRCSECGRPTHDIRACVSTGAGNATRRSDETARDAS